jgi:hypothetical protein
MAALFEFGKSNELQKTKGFKEVLVQGIKV